MIDDKELTKEQALSEHRKMWNWISDQLSLENCKVYDVSELKEKYVTEIYKGDESMYIIVFVVNMIQNLMAMLVVTVLFCGEQRM